MKKLLIAILFVVPFQAHALFIVANDRLNFGDVTVGDTGIINASFTLTCESGEVECQINGFAIPGSVFSFFGEPFPSVTEGAAINFNLTLTFTPPSVDTFTSVLSVYALNDLGDSAIYDFDVRGNGVAASVPEPSTLGLLGAGLLGLGIKRRKRAA